MTQRATLAEVISTELESISGYFKGCQDEKAVYSELLKLSQSVVRWSQAVGREANQNKTAF